MDREDYERIVRKHMDTIYRIAVSYTKNPADADDIVQQTFVKLLSRRDSFADAEHEKRWLIRVCVNECNSFFSSFWRKNVDSMDTISKEPEFTMKESSDLYEAIKQLPQKCTGSVARKGAGNEEKGVHIKACGKICSGCRCFRASAR